MRKISLLTVAVLLSLPLMASAWTLSWTPTTMWNDNTAIEPAHLPVSYIVEWDNAVQTPTTGTAWAIPAPSVGHGIAHTARVKARTATGIEGPFSPPFSWTSAEGSLGSVGGITVRP